MFCPNCGNKMNDGAVFCNNCGFSRQKVAKNNSVGKKIFVPIIAMLFVIVVIFAVGKFAIPSFNNDYLTEEEKCVNDFYVAMNDLKTGEISALRNHVISENLGSIEEVLSLFNVSQENFEKICKVILNSFEFQSEEVTKLNDNKYIINTKLVVPNSDFVKAANKNVMNRLDITDLGVLLGARDSKITKIIDKIIDGYTETDINDYGYNIMNYNIEMVKIGNEYKIGNFSNFLDNSSIGEFINTIRPIFQFINSILN